MKNLLLLFAGGLLLAASFGCQYHHCNAGRSYSGITGSHAGVLHHHHHGGGNAAALGPGGPPSPTYAYPYYTTRGPRDFLMANPPPLGP